MTKRISDAKLIADVRRVAKELGHCPTTKDYARLGAYNEVTLYNRFGAWENVIKAAGLRYVRQYNGVEDEELRRDLIRVANIVGHPPARADYQRHGRHDSQTILNRADANRWPEAVARIGGFNVENVRRHTVHGRIFKPTDERLAELRALADQLKRAPTSADAVKHGLNPKKLYKRVGTWSEILRAAGIALDSQTKQARSRVASDETIIRDIAHVARRLGHTPTYQEYRRHGKYGAEGIRQRLKSWRLIKSMAESVLKGAPINSAKHMGHVEDPTRDRLKSESVEAIKEFFKSRQEDR